MSGKHTAGPWFVSGVRMRMDGQQWLRVLQETPERELAFVPYADRPDSVHVEATANARLIAAAPELLEALLAIKRFGELANVSVDAGGFTGGKKPASKDVWQFPRHMLVDLDAAIAKATTA